MSSKDEYTVDDGQLVGLYREGVDTAMPDGTEHKAEVPNKILGTLLPRMAESPSGDEAPAGGDGGSTTEQSTSQSQGSSRDSNGGGFNLSIDLGDTAGSLIDRIPGGNNSNNTGNNGNNNGYRPPAEKTEKEEESVFTPANVIAAVVVLGILAFAAYAFMQSQKDNS